MRIVIDMQGAQTESRFRGIGRYTMSLAKAVVRNRGKHEVILVLNSLFPDSIDLIRNAFRDILPQQNIRVWHAPKVVAGNTWRHKLAELIREAFIASLKPDIVHISSLFEGYSDIDAITGIGKSQIPTVVTLYDLIPLLNSEVYLKPNPEYEHFYMDKLELLKQASQCLAISESAANEARSALSFSDDKVINISTACSSEFRPVDITEEERQKLFEHFCINSPFILYTGGCDSRKNLHRLIKAYKNLPEQLYNEHQLVLAGEMPDANVAELKKFAKSAGVSQDKLLFTGYISDNELISLYNLCKVFILPSLHEGFGLPALEAMSCGAAVITSNVSSLPEVIGNQNYMFDPHDETDISKKLVQVLSDKSFRSKLIEYGLEQAKNFSWDKSAQCAITAFEKLYQVSRKNTETEQSLAKVIQKISEIIPSKISDNEIADIALILNRNHNKTKTKTMFVDISELVRCDAKCGIQRVTRSILKELLKKNFEDYIIEPVYTTHFASGYRYARNFSASLQGVDCDQKDEIIDYSSDDIFLALDLHQLAISAQKEVLATMRRDGVKIFFVVYDLLPVIMPEAFPDDVEAAHKTWLDILMTFDAAFCISRTVADELAQYRREHAPQNSESFKIDWFHLGADIDNSLPSYGIPDDAGHVFAELAKRPTFAMIGTIEPRKGHDQTLDAFERLWEKNIDVNLVIVGMEGWSVKTLARRMRQHPEANKRLFWLKGASDEYLNEIYAASSCLIAASKGEGFGLPLIESAQHKLPIIARDIPVFREVAGEHAFYFKGNEEPALADAVEEWLELYTQGRALLSDNMPWLTWQESAEQLKQCLSSVIRRFP